MTETTSLSLEGGERKPLNGRPILAPGQNEGCFG